jgi:AAA family ATP:ADP antiporter
MNALKSFLDVKRREIPFVISMFLYFFLVITVFWILKPIKKAQLVAYYPYDEEKNPTGNALELFGMRLGGEEAELVAKVMNMVVAGIAVVVFTLLARKLHRHRLSYVFCAFSAIVLAYFAIRVGNMSEIEGWAFYLFGDLFNTLMVATFFAFLNDSVAPEDSKRLYGPIVLGGLAGGMAGTVGMKALEQSPTFWMIFAIVATGIIAVAATIAGRWVERKAPEAIAAAEAKASEPDGDTQNMGALAGAKLVFQSRYLISIVAIVGLYEMVSTIMDYQMTSTVTYYVEQSVRAATDAVGGRGTAEGKAIFKGAIGDHFASVYALTNTAAFIIQIFLTSFIMKRLGIRVALMIMPIAILGNAGLFLVIPSLWIGSMLSTTDNALNYSLNQSAKESLYTVTSREEKYAAKAFIDMFVQRFAKAIAVFLSLGVSAFFTDFAGVRWLSIAVIALVAIWLFAASYAGKRFRELSETMAKDKPSD